MGQRDEYSVLIRSLRGPVLTKELMARHTSYRIGGPADLFIEPEDREELATILQFLKEYKVFGLLLGKGSNLLVSDQGIRGVVFQLRRFGQGIRFDGDKVYVGAALSMNRLVDYAEEQGLGGIEFLAGIPGTVGGGLRMNAGAFGGEIGEKVEKVEIMTPEGTVSWISKDQLSFQYRNVKGLAEGVILSACMTLDRASAERISEEKKRLWALRKKQQPVGLPTCGSVFKTPPGAVSAGELIDQAGCKGLRLGGAAVSIKHANFIENVGGATAKDIWLLIQEVQRRVLDCFGVELSLEVKLVGAFD